ncbi:MAG: hypothetical protein JWP31_1283 [Aeromicrobium sp.]|nr:hypothetical protein [Aeromicrobium sp.]
MKRMLATALVPLLLLAGCGSGDGSDDDASTVEQGVPSGTPDEPTPSASTEAPTETPALVVTPGAIGAAAVGMTKAEAGAPGLFDVDVDTGDDGCLAVAPLRWKSEQGGALDVLTDEEGTIRSMGVTQGGPQTEKGIGVGSTYADVTEAYGDAVTPPTELGFGQAGVLLEDGDDWIGFLFDATVEDVLADPGIEVTFIEVTSGVQPDLIRDGC